MGVGYSGRAALLGRQLANAQVAIPDGVAVILQAEMALFRLAVVRPLFEFGFGAEVGISTDKLHVRGPMALEGLTTYKYEIHGKGQIRQ